MPLCHAEARRGRSYSLPSQHGPTTIMYEYSTGKYPYSRVPACSRTTDDRGPPRATTDTVLPCRAARPVSDSPPQLPYLHCSSHDDSSYFLALPFHFSPVFLAQLRTAWVRRCSSRTFFGREDLLVSPTSAARRIFVLYTYCTVGMLNCVRFHVLAFVAKRGSGR